MVILNANSENKANAAKKKQKNSRCSPHSRLSRSRELQWNSAISAVKEA